MVIGALLPLPLYGIRDLALARQDYNDLNYHYSEHRPRIVRPSNAKHEPIWKRNHKIAITDVISKPKESLFDGLLEGLKTNLHLFPFFLQLRFYYSLWKESIPHSSFTFFSATFLCMILTSTTLQCTGSPLYRQVVGPMIMVSITALMSIMDHIPAALGVVLVECVALTVYASMHQEWSKDYKTCLLLLVSACALCNRFWLYGVFVVMSTFMNEKSLLK